MLSQSWLIDWQNPLKGNEWREFFESLPKQHGVYQFKDNEGKILYVGQSKNLKNRLMSYRYVHPEKSSRKLCRLVHAVEKIEYEVCGDRKSTQVLEAKRIHELRPMHNRVFTHPESNRFIGFKILDQDRWQWKILSAPEHPEPDVRVFGAFSGTAARATLACFRRMEYLHLRKSLNLCNAPLRFFETMAPDHGAYEVPLEPNLTHKECERLARKVIEFMQGKNDSWLHRMYGKSGLLIEQASDHWLRVQWKKDFEQLQSFFRYQAQRNRSYASQYAVASGNPIGTHQLDLLKARTYGAA